MQDKQLIAMLEGRNVVKLHHQMLHIAPPTGCGCKGSCHIHYKDMQGAQGRGRMWHKDGKKYCGKCDFVTNTPHLRCKCCGRVFRTVPHHRSATNRTWSVFAGY